MLISRSIRQMLKARRVMRSMSSGGIYDGPEVEERAEDESRATDAFCLEKIGRHDEVSLRSGRVDVLIARAH